MCGSRQSYPRGRHCKEQESFLTCLIISHVCNVNLYLLKNLHHGWMVNVTVDYVLHASQSMSFEINSLSLLAILMQLSLLLCSSSTLVNC